MGRSKYDQVLRRVVGSRLLDAIQHAVFTEKVIDVVRKEVARLLCRSGAVRGLDLTQGLVIESGAEG